MEADITGMVVEAGQGADSYRFHVSSRVRGKSCGHYGDQLRCVVFQGLLPHVRQFVVTREGNDVNSLRKLTS